MAPRTDGSRLTRKVPLFLTALLVGVLAVYSYVEYFQLRRTLVEEAEDRMRTVAGLIAELLEQSAANRMTRLEQVATGPGLPSPDAGGGLEPPELAQAEERLLEVVAGSDQTLFLALVDRNGRCLVAAWRPGGAGNEPMSGSCPDTLGLAAGQPDPAAVGLGPLVEREEGTIAFTTKVSLPGDAAPGSEPAGYLVEHARVTSGEGARLISNLIASDARLLLGNDDGSLWTDFGAVVDGPPSIDDNDGPKTYEGEEGSLVGAGAPVPGSPWMVWIERRAAVILVPAERLLVRSAAAGLILVVLGSTVGWLGSRRVTRPLADLTEAAEAITAGEGRRRVEVNRTDEVGRLANAFNLMADRVEEARRSLEQRVEERTEELHATLEELREAQDALVQRERLAFLGQLAGGVGHELRNPLGVMTNALYYLDAVMKDPPAKVKEYLGILRTQVGVSQKIVEDLLDFARVKTPRREPIGIPDLVESSLERTPGGRSSAVDTKVSGDLPPVWVDRDQVAQVLVNLVSNAIQATDGAEGTVTIRAEPAGAEAVAIEVADRGVGISSENLDKIFEPLFTTKARGIGLGLAVSRSLAQANGGEISVESVEGEGSVFTLVLPTSKPESDEGDEEEAT